MAEVAAGQRAAEVVAGLRYAGCPWGVFTPELAVGAGQTPGSAVLQRINPWLTELLRGPALAATVNALVNVVEPPQPAAVLRCCGDARVMPGRSCAAWSTPWRSAPSRPSRWPLRSPQPSRRERSPSRTRRARRGPAREQVEQALAVLGDQVDDVLSDDRSPELLHEFYASIGLSLTWDHSARRLTAKLDLAPAVADLMGQAEPLIHRGVSTVSEGGLEPPCPVRGTSTSS